jgi:hypothetical protein
LHFSPGGFGVLQSPDQFKICFPVDECTQILLIEKLREAFGYILVEMHLVGQLLFTGLLDNVLLIILKKLQLGLHNLIGTAEEVSYFFNFVVNFEFIFISNKVFIDLLL